MGRVFEKDSTEGNHDSDGLENITRCLHQVFRPEHHEVYRPPGVGDCSVCEYDPVNNPRCRLYVPIKVRTYYVRPR